MVLQDPKANETVPELQIPVKYKSKVMKASDYGNDPNESDKKALLFVTLVPFR